MINDYQVFEFEKKEKIIAFLQGMFLNMMISILFYNSFWAMIPGMCFVFLFFKEKKRLLVQKRFRRMRVELKEFFRALIVALQTGRSVEKAFTQAMEDLSEYIGKDTEILAELKKISAGVAMGEALEKLVMEFAMRSHLEELEYFAEVFAIARRSGGNLVSIMKNTIRMIQEKMDVEEEIYTVIADKRFEFYLMCVIPLEMIIYLRISAGNLLASLYGNITGITVMTICLGIYGGCYFYGKRLLELGF